MRLCKKCGDVVPCRLTIDGKIRVLANRKYCLKCSPFGCHNTKRIHDEQGVDGVDGGRTGRRELCVKCGRAFPGSQKAGNKCYMCCQDERVARVEARVYSIVGESCWICGYNNGVTGRRMLDFHHMNREKKMFSLTIRNMCNLSWERVWPEIKKCVLVCCRCHREIEYMVLDKVKVENVFLEKWSSIEGVSSNG